MAQTKIKAGLFEGIIGNGTDGYFLMSNGDGTMTWSSIIINPTIASLAYPGSVTAADPAGGETVTLTGTGFKTGATVTVGGTAAPAVSYVSETQITFTTPAKAAGDYDIVVTNTDTGSATYINGISYNGIPTWTTAAGSLGTFASNTTISTITLQATEPDAGTITFNITNGALPTGLSLTGANIDGTTSLETADTLYTFTVTATDDESQTTPRTFTITVTKQFISTDNFTINTYTGNGSTQTIEGKIGTAAAFNGSSSKIDIPSISVSSISFWVYLNNFSSNHALAGNSSDTSKYLYIITDGTVLVNTQTAITPSTSIQSGTWEHIAFTESGGTVTMYLNGQSVGSVSSTLGAWNQFGARTSGTAVYLDGKLDQVRIFNKALSSSEVTTLYGENNTSTTKSKTDIFDDGSGVALYEFEKGAIDTGGTSGYIGSGGIFNGNGYIATAGTISGGQSWSISLWCYLNTSSAQESLFTMGSTSNNGFFIYRSGQQLALDSFGFTRYNNATFFTENTWQHLVITYSSGTSTIYLDGTSIDTVSYTWNINASATTYIGAQIDSFSRYLNGKLDQVRIFNKALSSSEVTTLYGETSASATKSTTDIFDDGSGVALYELEGNANDTGNYSFLGTVLKANNSPSNSQGSKVGWFRSDNLPAFSNASALSLWIRPEAAGVCVIYGQGNNASNYTMRVQTNASGALILERSASYSLASSLTLNVGQWNHVVYNFNNQTTSFDVWLNGTKETVTGTFNYGSSPTEKIFGAWYDSNYGGSGAANGSIKYDLDHIRVYGASLSDADVANLYAEENVRTSNLTAFYKLENSTLDETGNYNSTSSSAIYGDANYNGTATNVTYAYDGTPTNVSFLGTSFTPDLVWIKDRNTAEQHGLFDSVRGADLWLHSETTQAESNYGGGYGVTSFNSNGFSIGNGTAINRLNDNYVAWCWKAGGSAVSNTNGSITSQVSANQDAGFSIVSYTGSASANQTVGHGLSQTPELIIVKNRDTSGNGWAVQSSAMGGADWHMILNSTQARQNNVDWIWNDTEPTSTIFTVGQYGLTNQSPDRFIAYCFHSVDGYQKVGSYTGNGSSGGQTITGLGFNPRFLLVKNTTSAASWRITDSVRGDNIYLYPNSSSADDSSSGYISLITDGFRMNGLDSNTSDTFIYLAIA